MIERTADEDHDKVNKYSITKKSYDLAAIEKEANNVSIPGHYLNYGQEEQMEIFGYERCTVRTYSTRVLYILTLGILRLIYHWYPRMMLYSTHRQCNLSKAEKVLILENYLGKHKTYFVKKVQYLSINPESSKENDNKHLQKMKICLENGVQQELELMKVIWCKKLCYVWDPTELRFFRLVGLDTNISNSDLHKFNGLTEQEERIQQIAYRKNLIDIAVQSIPTLLCLEILNPFYIFQVFAIIVWLMEGYYYYNFAIVLMSIFGISSSILQTRKNQFNLSKTVELVDKVTVYRGKDSNTNEDITENIDSTNLVPGDIIVIPNQGCVLQSDCVLLKGGVCIVNESMLTGESVPVIKTPLPDTTRNIYNVKHDSNHTLYCGTKVIQTRHHGDETVKALVIRTGYLTAKGQLVRSILYPPPVDFKFDQDSYKFIGILAFIAFCGFLYAIIYKSTIGTTVFDIITKALDLITICIPPALPAAMTVGKIYALNRLVKKQIFCMNSRVINVSGSLDCVCFDKTGTLTEDGLDVWGIVPIEKDSKPQLGKPLFHPAEELSSDNNLLLGMVTCHSVNLIDNELSGDPLDVKMFQTTKWHLEEKYDPEINKRYGVNVPHRFQSPSHLHEVGVVNQYQFTSNLQRMSVITKNPTEKYCRVYSKGSPEKIMSLSKKETIPENLLSELDVYTRQGYRVIALATKILSEYELANIKKLERDDAECNLEFLGLLILENRLKPETTGVIDILKRAKIKIVMITGDNIETAISVARECEIIETKDNVVILTINKSEKEDNEIVFSAHGDTFKTRRNTQTMFTNGKDLEKINTVKKFAMSGSTWKILRDKYPERIPAIVKNGVVFARMSSDQKQQLVLELQALGYYVAMCGDGANDCGALKTAHAGISLSDTESSVASSFTSKIANISCVPKVIREGRAALITSFGIFKFMVAYSLTEFYSVILLYAFNTNLTDIEFLFIDICLVLNFALFFGKTKAYKGPLYSTPPANSLFNLVPLVSVFSQLIIYCAFQMLSLYLITTYPWYEPFQFDPNHSNNYVCYENYAIFALCLFQYILMAVTFSFGKPYRRRIYTNRLLMVSIILMTCICTYIVTRPAKWVTSVLELKLPPMEFRIVILLLAFANLCVSFIFEDLVVNLLLSRFSLRYSNKRQIEDKMISINQDKGIDNVTFIDENNENKTTSF